MKHSELKGQFSHITKKQHILSLAFRGFSPGRWIGLIYLFVKISVSVSTHKIGSEWKWLTNLNRVQPKCVFSETMSQLFLIINNSFHWNYFLWKKYSPWKFNLPSLYFDGGNWDSNMSKPEWIKPKLYVRLQNKRGKWENVLLAMQLAANHSTSIGCIGMNLCTDIHVPLRITCINFGDPVPSWSQIPSLVQFFGLWPNSCKTKDIPNSLSCTLCLLQIRNCCVCSMLTLSLWACFHDDISI